MRRYDLDWLRIGAFLALIGYHVGMLYVAWPFHVKSAYPGGPVLTALMLVLNPWRLPLLFVISGVATGFMLRGRSRAALARRRLRRLLLPLLFGMAVVVVPQVYFEVSQAGRYHGGFGEFWWRYLRLDQGFGTPVPTWNHLWFVAYLLVYTLVLAVFAPRPPAGDAELEPPPPPASRTALLALLLGPWALLWVLRMTLFPRFGSTHAMLDDAYNHALYFAMFAFGYALVGRPWLWRMIDRLRWPALGLAAVGAVVFIGLSLGTGEAGPAGGWPRWLGRAGREAQAWGAVLAALGFAQRHLNHDHPWRAYLVDVIFAWYIVHQTALIVLAVWLGPLRLGGPGEAAAVAAGTVLACVLTAELARRVRWLRPLFGFRLTGRRRTVDPQRGQASG